MKYFPLLRILVLLLFSSVSKAEEPQSLPEGFSDAQEIYAKERILLDSKYLKALEKLQDKVTKSGDLSGALFIKGERENLMTELTYFTEEAQSETQLRKQKQTIPVVSINSSVEVSVEDVKVGTIWMKNHALEWISEEVKGWNFLHIPWRANPIFKVEFNRSGRVFVNKVKSFNSASDLEMVKTEAMVTGPFMKDNWSVIEGKKGDTFEVTGYETFIMAESIDKM